MSKSNQRLGAVEAAAAGAIEAGKSLDSAKVVEVLNEVKDQKEVLKKAVEQSQIELARTHFRYFAPYVLRDSHTGDAISLSEAHEEWINHLYNYMNSDYNIGILACFGFGKTVGENEEIQLANGALVKMKDVHIGDKVSSVNIVTHQVRENKVLDVIGPYKKQLLKVATITGRTLEVGPDHRLFTQRGYVEAQNLTLSDFLYVPRNSSIKEEGIPLNADLCKVLGYYISEGSSNVISQKTDKDIIEDIIECAEGAGFVTFHDKKNFWVKLRKSASIPNVSTWLKQYDIFKVNSYTKRIPQQIFTSSKENKIQFFSAYFNGDGWVEKAGLYSTTASKALAYDLQTLLQQLGISSSVRPFSAKCNGKHFESWCIGIRGDAAVELAELMQPHMRGRRVEQISFFLRRMTGRTRTNENWDVVPNEWFQYAYAIGGTTIWKRHYDCFVQERKYGSNRSTVNKVIDVLYKEGYIEDGHACSWLASEAVIWDRIVSIEELEEEQVCYDLTIERDENFIVNGIVSHNSSLVIIGLALYLIGLNRNYRIGIVCNSDENATKRVQAIGGYIVRDERYHQVFPEITRAKNEQWNQHKIVVERDIIAPEGSIEACAVDCLPEGTKVRLFDGSFVSIEDVKEGDEVTSCDKFQLISSKVSAIHGPIRKQCLKLTFPQFREFECGIGHEFLTINGWKRAEELQEGDEVAIARSYPSDEKQLSKDQWFAKWFGYMLGDGTWIHDSAFTNSDLDILDDFELCCQHLGLRTKRQREEHSRSSYRVKVYRDDSWGKEGSPIRRRLDSLEVWGTGSRTKFIPNEILSAPLEDVKAFLAGYLLTDGSISLGKSTQTVEWCSSSLQLLQQLRSLLLRFSIQGRLEKRLPGLYSADDHEGYSLVIEKRVEIEKLQCLVPHLVGAKKRKLESLAEREIVLLNTPKLPQGWRSLTEKKLKQSNLQSYGKLAKYLDESFSKEDINLLELQQLLKGDIVWLPVEKIEEVGSKNCYDLTVEDTHNYVIHNDFICHNSTGIGSRYDILLFDDPVDQKDASSEAVRKSRIEKVSNTWFSRLEPGGKCVWIATRWHKHDATHEQLMRTNWKFLVQGVSEDFSYLCQPPIEYLHYPSVVDREAPKQIPLWEEKWPESELRARAEAMGLRAFNRGYRQRPYSDEDTLFNTEKVMAAIDWSAIPSRVVQDNWPRYLGVDLSGDKRPGTVIIAVARDPIAGKKYLLEIKRGNWGFTRKTADLIVEMFKRHRCTLGFVENNAAQETMLSLIKALHGCDIPLRGYTTGKNKTDPLEGLPGLAVEFENGGWVFPFGLPSVVGQRNQIASSQTPEIVLIRELIGWPHEADSDTCMALLFASRAASMGQGFGIPGIYKGTGQGRVFGAARENYFQPTTNHRQFGPQV